MKARNQGFTLVEIMIVVAIIAILAAVAIPNFVKYRKSSMQTACISNLKQIQTAVEQAKMKGIATPGWTDIIGSTLYIKVTPKCPASTSASYALPTDDTAYPTCNFSDTAYPHSLDTTTAAAST